MPRIPEATPQVQIQSAPSLRVSGDISPNAFGAATGRALQQLGDLGQNITAELQQRRNVLDVQKAYQEAALELQKFLHDPEAGVYTKKGVNSRGVFQEVQEKLPEIANKYTAGLSDSQRQMFDKFWSQTSLPELKGAMNHEYQELEKERAVTTKALTLTNVQNMALNYGDPSAVQNYAELVRSSVRAEAGANGWPLIQQQLVEQEALTKGYGGVFEQFFATGDYTNAEKVLNDYGKLMQPDVERKLRNDVREKKMDVEIQTSGDLIMAKYGDNEEAALQAVRDQFEGDMQTKVLAEVKTQLSDKRQIEDRKQNEIYWQSYEGIRGAKSRGQAEAIARRQTDPEIRGKLLMMVDQTHPIRTGEVKLTDEQKDQKKTAVYLSRKFATDEVKRQIDAGEIDKSGAAIATAMVKKGIHDPQMIDDAIEYGQGGGVYGKINRAKVFSVLSTEMPGSKYKTPLDMPQDFVNAVAQAAIANDGKISDRDIVQVVSGLITKGNIKEDPAWIGRTVKTASEYINEKGTLDGFLPVDQEEPQKVAEIETMMKTLYQYEAGIRGDVAKKITKDDMNALLRSWLPVTLDPEEIEGAQEAKAFYSWVKANPRIKYREDGRVVEKQITETDLKSPEIWSIMLDRYQNRGGR